MRKNVSGQSIGAQLISVSDGSNVTGGTTVVWVTGDAGTQVIGTVGSGLATHEGHGFWSYLPSVSETNFDEIAFTFVNSLAVTSTVQVYTTTTSGPTTVSTTAISGSSFSSNLTRDKLIEMAYKDIGVLADGEVLPNSLQQDGIVKLNSLIREIDATGKWLWAERSAALTLVANQWVYTQADGVPDDVRELDRVTFRDERADDWPVDILAREGYEAINNKTQQGSPSSVWLTVLPTIGTQTLYVWPAPATVNTQSEVLGTDALNYVCIRSHTADTTTRPITGSNWPLYWSQSGSAGVAWVANTSYTAPPLLLLWYRRPLYDFTASTDNPDMPPQWTRLLEYRLAADLADMHGVPLDERGLLSAKAKGAYEDIFKSTKPVTTAYHNKASYF